jgi:Domain of unknown function (DUF4260)
VTRPRLLLRVEGAAAAAAALLVYFHHGHTWWLLVLLILVPDLTFLGYLGGPRIGAAFYNSAHTYTVPLALAAMGDFAQSGAAIAVALVWIVHVGGDRALGYGLKYPTAFKHTHLDRV